ncbi:E3 UFM1-protein ligase 1 [Candidatus Bathyarchaeota archaeon]|nr:E3 UFM1-protein ligase 1 [Candidatus Bathyarchaeota archaeon]
MAQSIPLSKELTNELHKAAGRVIKFLRKDLQGVETDIKSINAQLTHIQERIDSLNKDLSKIEKHVKVIGGR